MTNMRINRQRAQVFMLAGVFGLMAVTLYMAFASPFSMLNLRESETSEIKAVILVGRHGEVTPQRDAYFEAYGEEPPEQWFTLGGPNQLTNMGKERMYLLGKYLRLRYHDKLLRGNPRRLLVRSENSDKCLESAQALIAGLNPPSGNWLWSATSKSSSGASTGDEMARLWQPKAVQTTSEQLDDLLSSRTRCLVMDSLRAHWKNTTRYAHLLNEFRHDLQILRQNTGLEFEDDLEMLANIEDQLRARSSLAMEADGSSLSPSWYTSTFASRLAQVADATAGCRFNQMAIQRLYVGRLLDTITKNIFGKIRSDLTGGMSLLGNGPSEEGQLDSLDEDDGQGKSLSQQSEADENDPTFIDFNKTKKANKSADKTKQQEILIRKNKLLPPEERARLKLAQNIEPNVFVYMTDKQHLTALLNSLKIYSSQPHYGSLLIIELHYDPINQIHFLRLFTVNSQSHNVLPEPVRVNPIACLDSVECSPQQFERNIRHLRLDKQSWQQSCQTTIDANTVPTKAPTQTPELTTPVSTSLPLKIPTTDPSNSGQQKDQSPTERSDKINSTSTTFSPPLAQPTETTTTTTIEFIPTESILLDESTTNGDATNDEDKANEENLLVGPTNTKPISSGKTTDDTKTQDQKQPLVTAIPSTLIEIDNTSTSSSAKQEPENTVTANEPLPVIINSTESSHSNTSTLVVPDRVEDASNERNQSSAEQTIDGQDLTVDNFVLDTVQS